MEIFIIQIDTRAGGVTEMGITHPHPEEPNTHVTNAGHGCKDKIHCDDGDQNIIQRKNL